MKREVIITGKTTSEAVSSGAAELGVSLEEAKFEVLEEARKGVFGIGSSEARVRVYIEHTPGRAALDFVNKLLENMEIDTKARLVTEEPEGASIVIEGQKLGVLIGRHGEVLEAVQYLATLAANKGQKKFYRVALDIENYKAKREQVLKSIARRTAEKVLKYKRSFSLEPMNAYERRIVHSECQDIKGVTTYSIGQGEDRKIVVAIEGKARTAKDN